VPFARHRVEHGHYNEAGSGDSCDDQSKAIATAPEQSVFLRQLTLVKTRVGHIFVSYSRVN
jgi:hypothetical protein